MAGIQAYNTAGNLIFDSNNLRVMRYAGVFAITSIVFDRAMSYGSYSAYLFKLNFDQFPGWNMSNTVVRLPSDFSTNISQKYDYIQEFVFDSSNKDPNLVKAKLTLKEVTVFRY